MDCHPTMLVSANRRIHWSRRAELQRYWRQRAELELRAVYWWQLERATIEAVIRYPDRRRRDVHNLVPLVIKPAIDGCVDAGLLPDDDDRHVVSVSIRRDPDPGPHRVTLIIEAAP